MVFKCALLAIVALNIIHALQHSTFTAKNATINTSIAAHKEKTEVTTKKFSLATNVTKKETKLEVDKTIAVVTESKNNAEMISKSDAERLGNETRRNKDSTLNVHKKDKDELNDLEDAEKIETKNYRRSMHCLAFYQENPVRDSNFELKKPSTKKPKHIQRLIYLLKRDVSNYTAEQMHMLLKNIADIKLDIYNYDSTALKLLIRTILKGKDYTFENLYLGLVHLFSTWNMNVTGYVDKIKKKLKIMRPPCRRQIDFFGEKGSTKHQFVTKKPTGKDVWTKHTKKHCDGDQSNDYQGECS